VVRQSVRQSDIDGVAMTIDIHQMTDTPEGERIRPLTDADLPAPYHVDLAALKTQSDYGEAAFELLKESSLLVGLLVGCVGPAPFQRNEAIRRGLIKRLGLLGKSLLSDICHNSGYQQSQISRQIIEAVGNYFYLADDDGSGSRYDAYIENSLAEEKASMAIVSKQIKERGDDPMPIEKRMRRSIERMASAAGMDYNQIPGKGKIDWPGAVRLLEDLSPVAYMPYRTGSNALHAGWSTLLLQDIEQVGEGFSLNKRTEPAVQPMTAAGLIGAEAALYYLDQDGSDAEQHWFSDRLAVVAKRIQELDEAHEGFMQGLEGHDDET
jgi:hypothetical protein